MKRWIAALALLLVPGAAYAFDPNRSAPPDGPLRIGVLHPSLEYDMGREGSIQDLVLRTMQSELRQRGFDVFELDRTLDELEGEELDADYLVEIAGGDAYSDDFGGIGIGNRDADVTLAVVASRVAGQVRIYDSRTLEVLAD